ncbi:MAG TPA: alkyl sulfatase dimerization domain-containing protein [Acidimicrobiales bacterium]|nr:alkyl sulfatase dimerization domain-containing protein [Acidimicrobiales bacterium]
MARDVLELADRLWRGEVEIVEAHPVGFQGGLTEIDTGVAFVSSFANVSAIDTHDGLVLVDTGASFVARTVYDTVRAWSPQRLNTAVFSHGHIDHVFGVGPWEEAAAAEGWPAPVVVAHEAVPARFDRYIATAGYNEVVNQRQFQAPGLRWPTEYRYPDRTYARELALEVGGVTFELHHARGETDDHTWTWFPQRRVVCCGDLFIWASPNAGNPQKVQRYPREWARALREIVALDPEVLLPGHGFPVVGADRVRRALTDTAELLESLVDQTLALMNGGARLDEVLHAVTVPASLAERPYLRPVYDEPEFVVRNIWRQYGGWWDGNPSSLKPAPEAALARELAALAGGPGALAERALSLVASAPGTSGPGPGHADARRVAGHLAELAALAAPADPGVHRARAEVFSRLAEQATSTMAKGVFSWAVRESTVRAEHPH